MAEAKHELIDAKSITDSIKDRVKAAFLGVIPEDAWTTLIEREINAFFNDAIPQQLVEGEKRAEDRDRYGAFGNWRTMQRIDVCATPFRVLVFEALYPLVRERLRATLDDERFKVTLVREWTGGTTERVRVEAMSDWLRQVLRDMAPEMVRCMFDGILASAAERTMEQIRQGGGLAPH